MRATIDGRRYSVGLSWHPVADATDIEERIAESGRDLGVILRSGKRILAVGTIDDEGKNPPPSAAALLALHYPAESLVAIERTESGEYWLGAVVDGVVVPGADALLDARVTVERHMREILRDFPCRTTGSASAEFGGDGFSILAQASSGKSRAGAAIKPLRAGISRPLIAILLLASVGAVWLTMPTFDKKAVLPSVATPPTFDREAELERQAIAERDRLLSSDLSGFAPAEFGRVASTAAPGFHRSRAWWKLQGKRCDESACLYRWTALAAGSTPERLAAALGVPRSSLSHDLRADTVGATAPLGTSAPRVVVDETLVLAPIDDALVDQCRLYNAAGGVCILEAAQPAPIPNVRSLPAQLAYRRGKFSLSGSLARMDALLATAFSSLPQIRANALDIDFEKRRFLLEARYVAP